MRRLISGPIQAMIDLVMGTIRGWDAFFFQPADPRPIGLIRICLGLLLLWNFGILGLDLQAFLGPDGWANADSVRSYLAFDGRPTGPGWTFWLGLPKALILPVYLSSLLTLILFTGGLWTRVTSVLTWIIVVSTIGRTPIIIFGFDQAASTLTLYLAVTGAGGQSFSIDRFLRKRRAGRNPSIDNPERAYESNGEPTPTVSANLCLRLIQLHLCLIYLMAGLAKLQSPIWWEGVAVISLLGYSEFRPIDLTWVAQWPKFLELSTHIALFLELSYAVLVWIRPIRPLLITMTLGLHVAIGITMGLYEFALAMMIANVAFFSGSWIGTVINGEQSPAASGGDVSATSDQEYNGLVSTPLSDGPPNRETSVAATSIGETGRRRPEKSKSRR